MPEELLQRLRDIHYPEAPGWFPPAPGWWVVAALLLGVICWLTLLWRKRARGLAPYGVALELLDTAKKQQRHGSLSARDYLDECNQTLKRLLIHIRGNRTAVSATGEKWLQELDRLHGTTKFTAGPGQVLGAQRYARDVPREFSSLHDLLVSFVGKLRDNHDNGTSTRTSSDTPTHHPEELA